MAANTCCSCSSADDLHRNQFWTNLAQLRADESFCDVNISINGFNFSAHKVVLSAATEYFNAMFLSGLAEQNSKEIVLQGFDPETFLVLLDFMYTGELKLTESNAANVLVACDMLNLNYAVKRCLKYLSRNINCSNCITLWSLAEKFNFNNLFFELEKFINFNLIEVSLNENLYEIGYPFLMSLLCSEDIQIDGEHQLLAIVIKWVSRNHQSRIQYLPDLIANVRLPMISEFVLSDELSKINDDEFKAVLTSVVETNRDYSKSDFKGLTADSSSDLCKNFLKLCDYDHWHHRQHVPRKSSRKRILVIGGFSASRRPDDFLGSLGSDDDESFGCVEMYDTYGGDWEVMAPLNQPRSNHCAVRCRNLVYVLGMYLCKLNYHVLFDFFLNLYI